MSLIIIISRGFAVQFFYYKPIFAKLEQTENGSGSWSSGHPSTRISTPQAALERSTSF